MLCVNVNNIIVICFKMLMLTFSLNTPSQSCYHGCRLLVLFYSEQFSGLWENGKKIKNSQKRDYKHRKLFRNQELDMHDKVVKVI